MTLIAMAGWLVTGCAADDGGEATLPDGATRQQSSELIDVKLNPGWSWCMEEAGTLHVIRTAEELAAHVTGGTGAIADVDFSRFSVLFASGRASNGIVRIERELVERFGQRMLQVGIYTDDTLAAPQWYVAVLVEAIPADEQIGLHIDLHNALPPLPVELTDVTLNPGWEWIEDGQGATRVIRSAEELAAYVRGGEGSPADVDFSRQAIFYVTGGVGNGIDRIDRQLVMQDGKRVLAIDIYLDETCVAPLWHVAVMMPLESEPEQTGVRVTVHNGEPLLVEQTDLELNPGWEWRMEEANTLHVIRTVEELAEHVTGGTGPIADVDFSRYSVLFASGRASNGIVRIDRQLAGMEGMRRLCVRLYLNLTEEAPLWHVALLVPAVPVTEEIGLDVQASAYESSSSGPERMGGLHLEVDDLVLNPGWEWRTDEQTAIYIIRSDVQLVSHMYKRKTNEKPANVDFTKNAVLFVPGVSSSNVAKVERTLYVGTRGFSLGIEIYRGMLTVEEAWHVAIVVPVEVANSRLFLDVKEMWQVKDE